MYIPGVKVGIEWVKLVACTLLLTGRAGDVPMPVYERAPVTLRSAHKLYTFFTQLYTVLKIDEITEVKDAVLTILSIKTLPDRIYLFTYNVIKFNSFFDLFNGMNCCCVVFTTKLTSNLSEA